MKLTSDTDAEAARLHAFYNKVAALTQEQRLPVLLTYAQYGDFARYLAMEGGSELKAEPTDLPIDYTGPAIDADGQRCDVHGAWVRGQMCGVLLLEAEYKAEMLERVETAIEAAVRAHPDKPLELRMDLDTWRVWMWALGADCSFLAYRSRCGVEVQVKRVGHLSVVPSED